MIPYLYMPELPEVHTTANILNDLVSGRKIKSVWTDYNSPYYYGKENIKDPKYFRKFKGAVKDRKINRVYRRAKNILIDIEGGKIILIHMKMTGQLLYGSYEFINKSWRAKDKGPLQNPYSQYIHLVFELNNGKHIAFSDARKFGTIKLINDEVALEEEFEKIGPEPLEGSFTYKKFKEVLKKKPNGYIKTVLMNPEVISGIGNIYSDEILFASYVLPDRIVKSLNEKELKLIFKNTKILLRKGIKFGGDSMSDYRNPYGEKGNFQLYHKVYGRDKEECVNCRKIIKKKVINGRSACYCEGCQK
jgi:formamidopyrimidine-DNA glycosylase